ncbi:MAG: family 10 glycosylhydrolase [Leptolyngbyaceae cyanobacterium CSU_1_4]|nr:family 10 glycosylhydrolase [Leptolyngbyaceae cyanobacterium CSU_1_4]
MILRLFSVWRFLLGVILPTLKSCSYLLFVLSLVGTLLWGRPTVAIAHPEVRGVWMTNNDMNILIDHAKVQDAMSQLNRLNFNTVYPVAWNSGYVMYPSAVAYQAGIQPFVFRGLEGQDILADVIAQGHRQGLLVMPWFEFGFMAPATSELALNHPNWLTQKRNGEQVSLSAAGEVAWLNPFHPEVQQFITSLLVELVTQYDADGIQFDDHMSLPSEFGYDRYTVALYTKETKKAPPADALDPAWVKWRADKITAFMVSLHKAVNAQKPQVVFSISPNYYDFAYRLHLQDWLAWVKQGVANELIVQVYRPDMQSFIEQINRPEIQEARKKIPTGIGVLTGLRNSPVAMAQIQSQVRAVQERGLGMAFFYYESLWHDAPEPMEERLAGFQAFISVSGVSVVRAGGITTGVAALELPGW